MMDEAYYYLALSAVVTVLMWIPHKLARYTGCGVMDFAGNFSRRLTSSEPALPLWAQRARRAHLDMIESLPAFVAAVVAAALLPGRSEAEIVGECAWTFYHARAVHFIAYTLGIPYLGTAASLASWMSILAIGVQLT